MCVCARVCVCVCVWYHAVQRIRAMHATICPKTYPQNDERCARGTDELSPNSEHRELDSSLRELLQRRDVFATAATRVSDCEGVLRPLDTLYLTIRRCTI